MTIHAYIIAYNEEKFLPFCLDYYSTFCEKIFIYDNMSTDGSDDIYSKYKNVSVIKWDSNNEINEINYLNIKNNCYKEFSRDVDWVIVCDCDEILYHPKLIEKLEEYKNKGITVPRTDGRNMVSINFPEYNGKLITDLVKIGSNTYNDMCKNIIFNPKLNVNYGIGAHSFSANGTVYSENAELKLLHYKYLGKEYVKNVFISRAKRLSEFNKQHKFGEHYFNLPFDYMDKILKENNNVI